MSSAAGDVPVALEVAEIIELLERVPELQVFPTVDEMTDAVEQLSSAYPAITQLRRVGSSRLGEPLVCLTIGSGSRHALIVAMPHPNEPIGALTAVELARILCEDSALLDSLDFSWHIIPCIDPDGTRLNEGWFKGPFTRSHYARHFYRPANEDQVEWTFPFSYKEAYFDRVLPETLALIRLIDELKPAFLCSLHNAENGGVYYYLSRPAPGLYPALHEIPAHLGVPLDRGEPDPPYVPMLAPAIFGHVTRQQGYDYHEQAGQDPVDGEYGESSMFYAARYGTLSLVSELPYWTDARADDETPSDELYSNVLRRHADEIAHVVAAMRNALEATAADRIIETPFLRASRCFVETLDKQAALTRWRSGQEESARPATAAEQWSCQQFVHMFRTRFPGMLVRALEAQIDAGLASPSVRTAHSSLKDRFDSWCEEAEADTAATMLPLRKLVATQLGAIVAAARYLERTGSE